MAKIKKRGEGIAIGLLRFLYGIRLLSVLLLMSGCAGNNDDRTNVNTAVEPAGSAQVLSTVEPTTAAAEPLPTATAAPTEPTTEAVSDEPTPVSPTETLPADYLTNVEVAVTVDPSLQDVQVNDNFYISYSNASPVDRDEAEGRSVALTVSLGSQSELSAEVTENSLVFIDNDGVLHIPEPAPDVGYQPYLVGSEIPAQDGVIGFVIFDLPPEVEEGLLVWCPEEPYPCGAPAEAKIDELLES